MAGEVVEAFGADPSRVRVVNPGVPELPVPSDAEAAAVLRRLLPAGVRRFCLAIGTAEPRKDLPGLVRAFDAVAGRQADVALVLAGPPGWGEQALDARRRRVGGPGQDRPHGLGRAQSDLAALLARASVLAYPSLYEGFGFPPLQAMRAGVPVVATRAGSLPEVLGDGALLVEPGDHDGLAEALGRCLGDEAVRRRLIAAGHGVVGPLLVGALRRRARGALSRRGGGPWLSGRARPCSSPSSSCGGACPAASASTPAACSAAWPRRRGGRRRSTWRSWPAGRPRGGRPTRWPRSAGRCTRRGCRAGS